jgi:hypothetical protein
MIMSIDGGTREALAPDAAAMAVAKPAGYPRFRIAEIVTEPMATVSAVDDPET